MASIDLNVTASGDTTLVAAPTDTSQFIRVYSWTLVCSAAETVTIKGGSTAKIGPVSFGANGGVSANDTIYVDLPNQQPLIINCVNGVQVGGNLRYSVKGAKNPN